MEHPFRQINKIIYPLREMKALLWIPQQSGTLSHYYVKFQLMSVQISCVLNMYHSHLWSTVSNFKWNALLERTVFPI